MYTHITRYIVQTEWNYSVYNHNITPKWSYTEGGW